MGTNALSKKKRRRKFAGGEKSLGQNVYLQESSKEKTLRNEGVGKGFSIGTRENSDQKEKILSSKGRVGLGGNPAVRTELQLMPSTKVEKRGCKNCQPSHSGCH